MLKAFIFKEKTVLKKRIKYTANTASWVIYVFLAYCKALFVFTKNKVLPTGSRLSFRDILPKPDFSRAELRILRGSALSVFSAVFIVSAAITVSSANINLIDGQDANEGVTVIAEEDVALAEEADAVEEDPGEDYTGGVLDGEVFAIIVDGKDIIYMNSKADAEAVLDGIADRFKTKGSEIIDLGFKEAVSIEKKDPGGPVPAFSVADAVSYIITGSSEPKTYTIKGGDSLWDIAADNGISLNALQEMNPGLNPKRLSIGQEVYLYETKPFITVTFTELVTSEERIAYSIVYEDNDSMYKGQTQVKVPGMYGSKQIRSEITKENGVVTSTVVLESIVISEPASQVTVKGTQPLPVYSGTGSGELNYPLSSMNVISGYGSRGGRQHHGVDLKGPVGTPIYAAADGVVVFSGRSGTFGNVVKISHGNGLETWYAHNESNLVSVGDVVTQGQQIANIGATGNATTSHLHFEVRINGASKNPMNYL